MRVLADQAFSRAAGAPLIEGNSVRLLRDAQENYPAWLDAIGRAQSYIHFESYIISEDAIGAQFAEALVARAQAGVRVRVIVEVDRGEHLVHRAERTQITGDDPGRHDEHRTRGRTQHAFGHRSEDDLSHTTRALCGEHHELRIDLVCLRQDLARRITGPRLQMME